MANTQNTGGQGAGNIRDKAESIGASAGRKVGETLERAGQQAGVTSGTQGTQGIAQRAKDTAADVAQRAQDVASSAAERVSEAVSSVGERVSTWGSQLRENLPGEGTMGAVADTVDAGTRYIRQHDLGEMMDDLGGVIRRYPLQSCLVAFGIGCFFGMASRR